MSRNSTWLLLSILLLLALFSLNVYRAWTQSITIDEAYTYDLYVAGPIENIFKIYIANHHVLHSVLCRISVNLFGLSELTMRIPNLLGGLFYMVTILRLCRFAFGEGWFSLLSFALLTMSPAVLDYMSVARGYGLALGFFFWAMFHMVRSRVERSDASILKAAVGLALSAASNLTFAFPGAALGTIFLLWLVRDGGFRLAIDRFLLPAILIASAILAVPLAHAEQGAFHFGARDLDFSVDSVVTIGWAHQVERNFAVLRWTRIAIPAVLIAAAAMCCFVKRTAAGALLTLTAGSLTGSVALLAGGHRLFDVLYPIWRTGLYWIPLFLLTCLLLIHHLANGRYRLAAAPFLVAAVVCLGQFVSQLNARKYAEWPGDASNRALVREIRKHHAATPNKQVRIAAVSWQLTQGMNFYRRMYRLDWIKPLDESHIDASFDYYVALPEDDEKLDQLGVKTIYQDPFSRAILAVPAR